MSAELRPAWVRDRVFYQIFPDRFARGSESAVGAGFERWDAPPTLTGFKGGDLWGVIERLPYLKDLGVDALYFNPIFSSTANHRYHTHDYLTVDPMLGGDRAFTALIAAAHAAGFRVVLDGVFNHASRSFLPFAHTLANGVTSPYLDWFHFNLDWLNAGRPLNPYAAPTIATAPTMQSASLESFGYRSWWDLPELPKFNTQTRAVREYLFEVAEHWIRRGVDGWRLDVPAEIADASFWEELRHRVRAVDAEAYLVGEIWDDATPWLNVPLFDGVTNYPFAKACLGFALGGKLDRGAVGASAYKDVGPLSAEAFATTARALFERHPESARFCQLNLLGSHDTPRILSLAGGDVALVKLALVLLFGYPGAPCIYYGDEIGTAGGADPDCRRGFEWDRRLWREDLRVLVQDLARLRRESRALRHGDLTVEVIAPGAVAWQRRAGEALALVVVNAGDMPVVVRLPEAWQSRSLESLVTVSTSPEARLRTGDASAKIVELPPCSGIIASGA